MGNVGLSYSMSKSDVKSHLKAMATYEIDTGDENRVAYITPDIIKKTETALFLQFDRGKLVEIASGKYEMDIDEFEAYLEKMLLIAEEWKSAGVTTVVESKTNNMYIYKDMRSYITISGSAKLDKYSVSISFTEKNYQEK